MSLFHGEHRRAALVVLILVGIVAYNQITTIAVLPVIAAEFGSAGTEVAWVIVAYVLGMALATAVAGPGIDAVGLRRTFRIAVFASAIGTAGCALAPDVTWLWMARLVQGIGSGILVAASLAAMGSAFANELRPRLFAAGSLAWAVVSIGSPLVSAAAIRAPFHWRGVFTLSLLVTVATGAIGWNSLNDPDERVRSKPDRMGLIFVCVFTVSSVTGLALRSQLVALPLLGLAALSGLLYWKHSSTTPRPLLDRRHVAGTPLGRTNLGFAMVFGAVLGTNAYLPFFARFVLHVSDGVAALAVMPLSVGWALGAVAASRGVRRFGGRPTALAGYVVLIAAFMGGSVLLGTGSGLHALLGVAGLIGIGIGLCEVASQDHVYSLASEGESGRVSAAHYFLRGVAYSYLAAAIGSLVLEAEASPAGVLHAYRVAYLGSTAITVMAVIVFSRRQKPGSAQLRRSVADTINYRDARGRAMDSDASAPVSGEAYVAGRAGGLDVLAIASSRDETLGLEAEFICITCGVQYPGAKGAPEACPICEDERQYVGWHGQLWTTLEEMRKHGYQNVFREEEPGLRSIETVPPFAIGQRALLVQTPEGNILWDCLSFLDEATVEAVKASGGLQAIAISHPHFYASMATWSKAFGDIPVYVHSKDIEWVQSPGPWVRAWEGTELELIPGATLVNCGGHFPGSTVLHWAGGADGKGVLLAGDTIKPVMDRRYVSFMYSIVNLIPLGESEVRELERRLAPFEFDRIYSLWNGHMVITGGKVALKRSVERYVDRIRVGTELTELHTDRT